MTGKNLRETFGNAYALAEDTSSAAAWTQIRSALAKYTTSGDGFDYNRMRYDAVWMMMESLKSSDTPLSVKHMKDAFVLLTESYEQQMREISFDASCHEEVRIDAMDRINHCADSVRRNKPRSERGEPLFVSFSRLCNDLPVLQRMKEAKPFIGDLKIVQASLITIKQDQAEYNAYYAMTEDFKIWVEGKECRDLLSIYGSLAKSINRANKRAALVNG